MIFTDFRARRWPRITLPQFWSLLLLSSVSKEQARRLAAAPSAQTFPDALRVRYEQGKGFELDSDAAKPLHAPYSKGESQRRYYQDAAIRAVLEVAVIRAGINMSLKFPHGLSIKDI